MHSLDVGAFGLFVDVFLKLNLSWLKQKNLSTHLDLPFICVLDAVVCRYLFILSVTGFKVRI